jgi:hypothetical protein
MKQILTFVFFLLFYRSTFGQESLFRPTYVFEGTIKTDEGRLLKFNMSFLILLDSSIIGSYFYKPSDGALELGGQLNPDNSFFIVERNNKDSITGYFKGILAADKRS